MDSLSGGDSQSTESIVLVVGKGFLENILL